MTRRRRAMGVDPACYDLAVYFLAAVKGATPEDRTELAEAIQRLCEDWCREAEGVPPDDD